MVENICDTCQAPEDFKKRVCPVNRLHNAFEVFKAELLNGLTSFGYGYTPDIQCWCKELLEEWEAAYNGD